MSKYDTIIVEADYMSSGLWAHKPKPSPPRLLYEISHESVGLSKELSKKFNKWINSFWDVYDRPDEFNCEEFNKTGAMLAAELQQFLGKPCDGAPTILFKPQLPLSPERMKEYYGSKESKKNKRCKHIAVDLDGTLLQYDGTQRGDVFGDPIPGMIEVLQGVRDAGWKIIIWTVRRESPAMIEHLNKHKIPYNYINGQPWPKDGSNKVSADLSLDDRAICFDGNIEGLLEKILEFKPWNR